MALIQALFTPTVEVTPDRYRHKKSHLDEPNGDYYLKIELMPVADAKAMSDKDNTFWNIVCVFLNSDVNLIINFYSSQIYFFLPFPPPLQPTGRFILNLPDSGGCINEFGTALGQLTYSF